MSADIEERVEKLESLVREQQATIEAQRERIADLAEETPGGDADAHDVESPAGERAVQAPGEDDDGALVSRRGAVKAGGLLALAGLGASSASANATGQVGTSSRPLSSLYTQELRGVPAGNGPLEVLTDGSRALELGVPTSDGSREAGGNVVAGHPNNTVNNNAVGVVIGGGGAENGNENTVGDDYATVGGGLNNTASGNRATVGGGLDNTASGNRATVPGGILGAAENDDSFVWNDGSKYHAIPNTFLDGLSSSTAVTGESVTGPGTFSASASNGFRFITGGASFPSVVTLADDGSQNAQLRTWSGGLTLQSASGNGVTIETDDDARALELGVPTSDGTFTAGANVLAGHPSNSIENNAVGAVVGGGGNDETTGGGDPLGNNVVYDNYGTIGGGNSNQAGSQDSQIVARGATVAGGLANGATGEESVVGGGRGNIALGEYATIAGGANNEARALGATVGGGGGVSSPSANRALGNYSTVAGGTKNDAGGAYATVGGGENNSIAAEYGTIAGGGPTDPNNNADTTNNVVYDNYGTVGGGGDNIAGDPNTNGTTNAIYATVGGGKANDATGERTTVGGGLENSASAGNATVGGGSFNMASDFNATVSGGAFNTASGSRATVPGGGRGAAESAESFVWNDSTEYHTIPNTADGLSSDKAVSGNAAEPTGANTFSVSATGGVRFITGSASSPNVTYIPGSSAGWSTTSSRTVKTNIDPVDPKEALDGVESLEVATWEYTDKDGEGAGTTHIGPMAEQFHGAFEVGSSDEHINSINADGVAFAAIQGLSAELEDRREQLDEREQRIADLETESERKDERIDELEARLADLEDSLASDSRDG